MTQRVTKTSDVLVDQRLAKALVHPVRAEILTILNERVASPNEISKEIDAGLPTVSYHVKTLLDLGCIELVDTARRRGAIESYYRALVRPFFSDADWERLPQSARQSLSDKLLQIIWRDVSASLDEGLFDARDDRHLTRSPLVLDEEGWNEINELLAEVVYRAMDIVSASADRLAKTEAEGFTTRLMIMHFESSPAGKRSSERRRGRRKKA